MANLSNLSSKLSQRQFSWDAFVLLIVTFWLSSSVLLDFVMMPMMYESGMMSTPDFPTAGYSLFWVFNRVEMLCAAAILTGLLVLRQNRSQYDVIDSGSRSRWALWLSGALLAIAFTYTYLLTPQMSALGLNLSGGLSDFATPQMNLMHALYWGLEALKLVAAGLLVKLCYRDMANSL
ncbi:DUF4149 domain-containing protein [cf. Phormidesmis sp. LEGE 11477]|uniref:DUF4149 domain-containing protein n=1 Tax=cf. Phormidesmis sp. LEGE 11477 TaxID=1828680 RepID=UPI00187EB6A3|nr:DUF4149 domain-containing protein [cf. Phormidesmis sp. LEGE 11477]MBE9064767.1 DUF4149 domain-containing protein [cf. Phormidesmis sp. LEGE 11477]